MFFKLTDVNTAILRVEIHQKPSLSLRTDYLRLRAVKKVGGEWGSSLGHCRAEQQNAVNGSNIASTIRTWNNAYCYNYYLRICLLTKITISIWRAHNSRSGQFVTAHVAQCLSDYKSTCTIPTDSHTAVRRYTLHYRTWQTELSFIAQTHDYAMCRW